MQTTFSRMSLNPVWAAAFILERGNPGNVLHDKFALAAARLEGGATADSCITVLNEALALDPEAMRALLGNRVPCCEELANHPTIQAARVESVKTGEWEYRVGMLGIINGIFGIQGDRCGFIAVEINKLDGAPIRFLRRDVAG